MQKEERYSAWGLYTLLVSLVALVWFSWQLGLDYQVLLRDIVGALSGNPVSLPLYDNLAMRLVAIGQVISVSVVLALASLITLQILLGKKEVDFESLFLPGFQTSRLMFVVTLEELFARGLFVGVLPKVLPGSLFLYILIGNTLWAGIHVWNFKKTDRNPLMVLPQFIGGFFLAYVFLRWGLFWVIMAHFSYNAVVLSLIKRKDGWADDFLYGLWYGGVFVVFSFIAQRMGLSLAIFAPWVNQNIVPLNEIGFGGYFVLIVLLEAAVEVVLSILGYDPAAIDPEMGKNTSLITYLLGAAIVVGLVYLGSFIGRAVGANATQIAIGVTIVFALLTKTDTLSAMSRTWFKGVVTNYVMICAILVLGFWPILGMYFLSFWLDLFPMTLRQVIGQTAY